MKRARVVRRVLRFKGSPSGGLFQILLARKAVFDDQIVFLYDYIQFSETWGKLEPILLAVAVDI